MKKMNKTLMAGAVGLILASSGALAADPARTSAAVAANITPTMTKVRASDLLGADIVNDQNETIGRLEDLVIDNNGHIMAVVSVGGFLGLGEKRVTAPYEQLRFTPDRDKVRVSYAVSKDQLKDAPAYDYQDDALNSSRPR